MTPTIRPFQADDAAATYDIFYNAVHITAASHYPKRHRDAWARSPEMSADWSERLASQISYVACAPQIAGFITLNGNGYLDFIYTHPDHIRQGVASALYAHMLAHTDITHFTTEASHLSRPFFLAQGWRELAAQKVERYGEWITNFQMEWRR